MTAHKLRCVVCSSELSAVAEFFCCRKCGSPVHEECRATTDSVCPKCGGSISADPYVVAVTPGLDMTVAATSVVAVVLLGLSAVILSMVPIREDAPGTAGIAFYFMVVPVAGVGLVFACLTLLALRFRKTRRRPTLSRPGDAPD